MRRMFSLNQLQEISKQVIKSGLVENAKPIYCHPITLTNSLSTSLTGRFNALVFNNDDTPLTKESLITLLKSSASFRLILTGGCNDIINSKIVIASHAYFNGSMIFVMGIDIAGNIVGVSENINFEDFINDTNTGLADNVNKIN